MRTKFIQQNALERLHKNMIIIGGTSSSVRESIIE